MTNHARPATEDTPAAAGAEEPGWGRRRTDRSRIDTRMALTIGAGVTIGLLLFAAVEAIFSRLVGIAVAVLVSLFLSFAMEPAVEWLDERGLRRGLATATVFLAALLAMVGFAGAMAPLVIDQVQTLVDSVPQIVAGLSEQAERLPGDLGDRLAGYLADLDFAIEGVGTGLLEFGTTLAGGIFQFLTVLLVTFYLVADGPRFRRAVSSRLPPRLQGEVLAIWELAIEKTGGYVYGRVLVAIASTVFHIMAFQLIGLPYSVALGVWVGVVSSLIPVVGTYLAGALPVIVALSGATPFDAVWVAVAVVIYQQIENYLIAPRITAHTMELHPAIAFISVLAGASLLGASGALLALPAAAVIGGVFAAVGERHEIVDHRLVVEPAPRASRDRRRPGATEGAADSDL